jgi:hypothetical protein
LNDFHVRSSHGSSISYFFSAADALVGGIQTHHQLSADEGGGGNVMPEVSALAPEPGMLVMLAAGDGVDDAAEAVFRRRGDYLRRLAWVGPKQRR